MTPNDRTDDFEIGVSGVNRVSVTEISRDSNAGTIVIDVRGTKATPANKPNGDTTIEAKLDGHVCGSAQAIVIVPKEICGPCPSGTPATGNCPQGSQRDPENLVADATTSPAYFLPLEPDEVKLWTVWIMWMTIEVCDQFGNPLDAMYEGCCVEEFVPGRGWRRINQAMSDQGTYQDPVFRLRQPSPAIVDRNSQAAQDWPDEPTLSMGSGGSQGQAIPVRVCGHSIGDTGRKVVSHPPNCVWVECPPGKIIV